MDYPTASRDPKKPSSTGSTSSSRRSTSATTESASVRYFTAFANSSAPYESPYAQVYDKRTQSPTTSGLQTSTAARTASPSARVAYTATSLPSRGNLSTYSSSSGGSLYTTSRSNQQRRGGTPGSMSSSKPMSAVSTDLTLCCHYPMMLILLSYSRVIIYSRSRVPSLFRLSAPELQ